VRQVLDEVAGGEDVANARDIDNLTHEVLRAFEELYCLGRRGTVIAYRAYDALPTPAA
jgi:hypothetical protein